MNTQLIILIAVVVLVLMGVVAFFVRRSEAKNGVEEVTNWPPPVEPPEEKKAPVPPAGLNAEIIRQINVAMGSGRKLEAIKLYREATGISLAEAKAAVEDMERNPAAYLANLTVDTERPSTVSISREAMSQVFSHIRSGNKIEAIKLYREQTGLGLKEAKDAVDALEKAINAGIPVDSMLTAPPSTNLPQGNWMQEVMDEIRAGRKINAIKIYRENSGLGLKESKDAVDALEKNL